MATILRPKAAWTKLGVGRTTFLENFVERKGASKNIPGTKVRRLRPPLKLGERARGFPDDEIDSVAEALRAERDAISESNCGGATLTRIGLGRLQKS